MTIAPAAAGWLVTCDPCRWESYHDRRPAADKAAHEHNKTNHKEG